MVQTMGPWFPRKELPTYLTHPCCDVDVLFDAVEHRVVVLEEVALVDAAAAPHGARGVAVGAGLDGAQGVSGGHVARDGRRRAVAAAAAAAANAAAGQHGGGCAQARRPFAVVLVPVVRPCCVIVVKSSLVDVWMCG